MNHLFSFFQLKFLFSKLIFVLLFLVFVIFSFSFWTKENPSINQNVVAKVTKWTLKSESTVDIVSTKLDRGQMKEIIQQEQRRFNQSSKIFAFNNFNTLIKTNTKQVNPANLALGRLTKTIRVIKTLKAKLRALLGAIKAKKKLHARLW